MSHSALHVSGRRDAAVLVVCATLSVLVLLDWFRACRQAETSRSNGARLGWQASAQDREPFRDRPPVPEAGGMAGGVGARSTALSPALQADLDSIVAALRPALASAPPMTEWQDITMRIWVTNLMLDAIHQDALALGAEPEPAQVRAILQAYLEGIR